MLPLRTSIWYFVRFSNLNFVSFSVCDWDTGGRKGRGLSHSSTVLTTRNVPCSHTGELNEIVAAEATSLPKRTLFLSWIICLSDGQAAKVQIWSEFNYHHSTPPFKRPPICFPYSRIDWLVMSSTLEVFFGCIWPGNSSVADTSAYPWQRKFCSSSPLWYQI